MRIKNNKIATLSSKVRNDRGMDSRFHGNDISGMMGLPRRYAPRNDREREKKNNKRGCSGSFILFL